MNNIIDGLNTEEQKVEGFLSQKGDRQQIEIILKQNNEGARVDIEVDNTLLEIVAVVWKKLWLILLCGILGASVLYAITDKTVYTSYQSSITMYVNGNIEEDSTKLTQSDMSFGQTLIPTYVEILKSNTVLDKVAESIGLGYTRDQLKGMISTSNVEKTGIVKVTVSNTNQDHAALIANSLAETLPEEIVRVIRAGVVEIIDYADTIPIYRSANLKQNVAIGLLGGMVLAVLLVLVIDMLDDRIRDEKVLENQVGIPVLGSIQTFNLSQKKRKKMENKST